MWNVTPTPNTTTRDRCSGTGRIVEAPISGRIVECPVCGRALVALRGNGIRAHDAGTDANARDRRFGTAKAGE